MYCIHCGKEMDASAKFCPACGKPVAPQPEQKHQKPKQKRQEPRKVGKSIAVVALLLVVVIAVGAVLQMLSAKQTVYLIDTITCSVGDVSVFCKVSYDTNGNLGGLRFYDAGNDTLCIAECTFTHRGESEEDWRVRCQLKDGKEIEDEINFNTGPLYDEQMKVIYSYDEWNELPEFEMFGAREARVSYQGAWFPKEIDQAKIAMAGIIISCTFDMVLPELDVLYDVA